MAGLTNKDWKSSTKTLMLIFIVEFVMLLLYVFKVQDCTSMLRLSNIMKGATYTIEVMEFLQTVS